MRFDVLEQRARSSNPLLRTEESQIQAAEKTVNSPTRTAIRTLRWGVTIQYGKSIREWELMVEVTIPFAAGHPARTGAEAQAMLDAAPVPLPRSRATNRRCSRICQTKLMAWRQLAVRWRTDSLPQSELTFRSALQAMNPARWDFATLLDAQRQTIRQAKLNQVRQELRRCARKTSSASLERTATTTSRRARSCWRPRHWLRAVAIGTVNAIRRKDQRRRHSTVGFGKAKKGAQGSHITAIRWGCPIRPHAQEGPDGDGLHPGLRGRSGTGCRSANRSRSAPTRFRSSGNASRPPACATWTRWRARRPHRTRRRLTYAITPKFEGYVERLRVNATGQAVGKGQPLFEVWPELVSAQREYAIAAQGSMP